MTGQISRQSKENRSSTGKTDTTISYGDLNYLGSNKAIFYFDRERRGNKTFNNSIYPLEQQPKYKDLVVINNKHLPINAARPINTR